MSSDGIKVFTARFSVFDELKSEFDEYCDVFFPAISKNESFARTCAAAFVARLNPTMSDITDVKTAVSEAVTNAIIHGYSDKSNIEDEVRMFCGLNGRTVTIVVADEGVGIDDVGKAREPLFTSRPDLERSGMGFTVIESFMDSLEIESKTGDGTIVIMKKVLR